MSKKDNAKSEDGEEDWSSFSNAGFGSTAYDLWEDVGPIEEAGASNEDSITQLDENEDLGDNEEEFITEQLDTHLQEIPTAPSAEGLKHLVRLGTCDHCLGRIGGKKSFGQSLLEAGTGVRELVVERDANMSTFRSEETVCPFCEELFAEVDLLAEIICDELSHFEFARLQIGAQFPKDQTESEDNLRKRYGAPASLPLKSSLTDTVARTLVERLPKVKMVNEHPEILAILDMLTLSVTLEVRSHFIYGRYRKLERGIPQTRWPCRSCKGRGCERCDHTGKQYETSVQDLIGEPIIGLFEGEDHAFHGMGREDIDVRCMGRGRPFVIEIKNPRKRNLEPSDLESVINSASIGRIEVDSMRQSRRSEVVRIKDTPAEKSYRVRFKVVPQGTLPPPVLHKQRHSKKGRRGRGRGRNHDSNDTPEQAPAEAEPPKSNHPDVTSLSKMKKDQLVAICVENNLAKSGTKVVLVDRLSEYFVAATPTAPPLPDLETIRTTLAGLAGTVLEQRTPTRVAHRRADKVRKRSVLEAIDATAEKLDGEIFAEVTLRCESGTYVKETIHGDGGRTTPSVAGLLGIDCDVEWLDVADIHAD